MASSSAHSSFSSDRLEQEEEEILCRYDLPGLIAMYDSLIADLQRDVQNLFSRIDLHPPVEQINWNYNGMRTRFDSIEGMQNISEEKREVFQRLREHFHRIDHLINVREWLALAENPPLDSLPTIIVSQAQVDAALSCPICMENFHVGSEVCKMPCHETHLFHSFCITSWLEEHSTCPTCRTEVVSTNSQNLSNSTVRMPETTNSGSNS